MNNKVFEGKHYYVIRAPQGYRDEVTNERVNYFVKNYQHDCVEAETKNFPQAVLIARQFDTILDNQDRILTEMEQSEEPSPVESLGDRQLN